MKIDASITSESLRKPLQRMFELSGKKIWDLERSWDESRGTPVFTAKGKYTTRGWTEWTRGFQFGSALLQFDATGETEFVDHARLNDVENLFRIYIPAFGTLSRGFYCLNSTNLLSGARRVRRRHDYTRHARRS